MLKIINKTDTQAEMYITGDIIDDEDGLYLASWGEDGGYTFPEKVKNELDSVKGKNLTIYINSDGGSVPAGVAIASMIARHDGHTKAVVDGWACSVATQIFFSAKERVIPSNAYLMIHKPWISIAGDADELRKTAEILDVLQEGIETTYRKVARDGVTAETIHAMVDEETWLTGTQAAEYFDVQILEPQKMVAKRGRRTVPMAKVPTALTIIDDDDDTEYPPSVKNKESDTHLRDEVDVAIAIAKGATAS